MLHVAKRSGIEIAANTAATGASIRRAVVNGSMGDA
jgi:hypothetical protein